jgi:hypothetical protein
MTAVERMDEARKAVKSAFEIEGTAAWRRAIIDHVVLQERSLKDFALPVGMTTSPVLLLNDALEPVAILLMTAPAGVKKLQPSRRIGLGMSYPRPCRRIAKPMERQATCRATRTTHNAWEERQFRSLIRDYLRNSIASIAVF